MSVIPKIPRASGGFASLGPLPGFYPGPAGDPSPTHTPLTTNPGSAPADEIFFDILSIYHYILKPPVIGNGRQLFYTVFVCCSQN